MIAQAVTCQPFCQAYPTPWRLLGSEIVDRDGFHLTDFDEADAGARSFWQGVCDAVNQAARDRSVSASPDMGALLVLRADPEFQAALRRYAHENGSSDAVALALLSAARFWTLRTVLGAAAHALRSYEHGNASPDLAKSIADLCDAAVHPKAREAA